MKSYTNLEQSRKLAEILPLESADMYYAYDIVHAIPYKNGIGTEEPCWSLAALLNVLPKGTRLLKSATDDTYHCDCPKGNIDKWYDNSVDACYEMIIKLYEQKLL